MNIEVLLVQFLILAFTGVLWWIARRDLAARAVSSPPLPPPADTAETADLEQLCATLETLVTRLSRRLDVVERQMAQEAVPETPPVPQQVSPLPPTHLSEPARLPEPARMEEELARIAEGLARMEEGLAQRQAEPVHTAVAAPPVSLPPVVETIRATEPAPDPRYAPVYAMLDEGVTDPVEIARRTGLGRGEVELIVSLRERRAF